ncbi:Hypothetical predicted protein [Paramuricea clavata]|uniref:Transposable element P transposase-like GTP-binding insertion domain-containing protein n=1 Tax=Paramuricea clavata TaxID=317549 RepID=A0A6S7I2E8_PARCT|nr:Hypothetical predicted protein [Paramuricea clavata]
MKVRLAAQVMSNTVAMALHRRYPQGDAGETAKFCEMVNKFFDCRNTRSTTEHIRKRNEFLAEYTSLDDSRFDWLQNVSLHSFRTGTRESKNDRVHLQVMKEERCSSCIKHTKG